MAPGVGVESLVLQRCRSHLAVIARLHLLPCLRPAGNGPKTSSCCGKLNGRSCLGIKVQP